MHGDALSPVKAPRCPRCGQVAQTQMTQYGERHRCCGLHSWRGKPLASMETHIARQVAHAKLDPLWQDGTFKRGDAYWELALELNIPLKECHISTLELPLLELVPAAVERIRERGPRTRKSFLAIRTVLIGQKLCRCNQRISKKDTARGITVCKSCRLKCD